MESPSSTKVSAYETGIKKFADFLVFIVVLISSSTLISWYLRKPVIHLFDMDFIPMNPLTAVCFLMSSSAYFIYKENKKHSLNYFKHFLLIIVILLTYIKIMDRMLTNTFRIDEFLFNEHMRSLFHVPMSVNTAFSIFLLNISMLAFGPTSKHYTLRNIMVLLTAGIGGTCILGYLFGVSRLYFVLAQDPMALQTGISILFFSFAILFRSPNQGIMRAFSGKMAGSISARRLIPVVAILPATLGFLFFMAYRHNLISSETGMAVIILTLILIFLFLLRYHAESLNQWANKRLLAEHEVRVLNEQLEQKVKERTSDLEQSEANLQAIFNNTAVGFLLLNTHYEILSFNERFKSAFLRVYEKQINIHQNYLDLFPQERRMFMIDQFIQAASYNQLVEYEISIPEGQPELYFRVNIIPVKSQNELVGYSVSVTEITQRRILKLQIEKMNQDLIQRNKELEQFTFIVSHNLRSPIANISGISNILVDPNIDESNLRKMGSEMAKSIRRLDGVVQDLNMILDVKKGLDDASEPVSLTALVNGIKESISTVIEETGTVIYLDFNACNEMITIRSYLHSIFYNLITNSIKYRKLDNPCEISISSRIQEKQLIIEFSDNGIGMDLETMGDQLFGLYKRFHRNIEGKGVGLYIVKLQVESLGGMISVASTLNKGTTFTITFKMN